MSLRKRVSKLEQNISHLMKLPGHRHHDLDKQIRTLFDNYNKLQKQIECGLAGHDFEIAEDIWPVYGKPTKHPGLVSLEITGYEGEFQCRNCSISYSRKLTTQEANAAKKLGLIAK